MEEDYDIYGVYFSGVYFSCVCIFCSVDKEEDYDIYGHWTP